MNEDWEATSGMVQYLFTVESSPTTLHTDVSANIDHLRQRFAKEPLFLDIMEALYDLDCNKPVKAK